MTYVAIVLKQNLSLGRALNKVCFPIKIYNKDKVDKVEQKQQHRLLFMCIPPWDSGPNSFWDQSPLIEYMELVSIWFTSK